jgi:hypothetical protein
MTNQRCSLNEAGNRDIENPAIRPRLVVLRQKDLHMLLEGDRCGAVDDIVHLPY